MAREAGFLQPGGMPKICVPLCGADRDTLLRELEHAKAAGADMAEWRIDLYDWAVPFDEAAFAEVLAAVQSAAAVAGLPLLLTCRSRAEGGRGLPGGPERDVLAAALLANAALKAPPAYIDLELGWGTQHMEPAYNALQKAHGGCGVVLSFHDFERTPPDDTLWQTLCAMRAFGQRYPAVQTVPKLAVMPKGFEDTLRFMALVHRFQQGDGGPLVAMAMGQAGKLSRVAGESFGSCLSFGAGLDTSAPGQIPVAQLRKALQALHK